MDEDEYLETKELPTDSLYEQGLLSAIGSLMLTASVAEHFLTGALAEMLGAKPQSTMILPLEGMELRVKLQLLRTLVAIEAPDHRDNIRRICKKIERAYKKRNLFAHGMVYEDGEAPEIKRDKLVIYFAKHGESGIRPQPETLDAQQIRLYGKRIFQRVLDLENYLIAIGLCTPRAPFQEQLTFQ